MYSFLKIRNSTLSLTQVKTTVKLKSMRRKRMYAYERRSQAFRDMCVGDEKRKTDG